MAFAMTPSSLGMALQIKENKHFAVRFLGAWCQNVTVFPAR